MGEERAKADDQILVVIEVEPEEKIGKAEDKIVFEVEPEEKGEDAEDHIVEIGKDENGKGGIQMWVVVEFEDGELNTLLRYEQQEVGQWDNQNRIPLH